MAGLDNFPTLPKHKTMLEEANLKMKMLSQELYLWVHDGVTFPCLSYIRQLISEPDTMGVIRDIAIRDVTSKSAQISQLQRNFESFAAEFTGIIRNLDPTSYQQETLDNAINSIDKSAKELANVTSLALQALQEAVTMTEPQPQNKFISVASSEEPPPVPRDISPSDFSAWLSKFQIFSDASWVPGPPLSGERLRQLHVYLDSQWEDVTEGINWSQDSYDLSLIHI